MKTRMLVALAALLGLGRSANAEVWIVSAAGIGDFTEIQPAVDAAAEGDTIVVRPGDYPAFAVDGKGLTIVAVESGVVTESIQVTSLPAGSTLALRSIDTVHVVLTDCAGTVWLEDCSVRAHPFLHSAGVAVLATNCANVVISGCDAEGTCCFDLDGPPGLLASASRIALYDSSFLGGGGAWPTYGNAGDGGDGVRLEQGSFLLASGCRIEGGEGGVGGYGGSGGDGGDGLVVSADSQAWLLDTLLVGGWGGGGDIGRSPGSDGDELVGNATTIPGTARHFDTEPWAAEARSTTWRVEGEPGDRVWLLVGERAGFLPMAVWSGVLAVYRPQMPFGQFTSAKVIPWIPFDVSAHELGTIPAQGALDLSLDVLQLAAGAQSHAAWLQPILLSGGNQLVLARPSLVTTLDCDGGLGPDCNRNGINDLCELADGTAADTNGNEVLDECEGSPILYVDADAAPGGDGQSWATAYDDLQDALAFARSGGLALEIWVAEGTYLPGLDAGSPFELVPNVDLYGGFAGGEASLAERDLDAHPTVLSGDLDQDGTPAGNALHVIFGADGVRLDGFVVRDGEGSSSSSNGGGLLCIGSSFDPDDGMVVSNCHFTANRVRNDGAAISIKYADLSLVNCVFTGNEALLDQQFLGEGGAVDAYNSDLLVRNCAFSGNRAEWGGAIRFAFGHPDVGPRLVSIVNSSFSQNRSAERGAGICFTSPWGGSELVVANSVFWGNFYTESGGTIEEAQVYAAGSVVPEVRFSDLEGLDLHAGHGNIGLDPQFVDPNGPDGLRGTPDDDLRLADGSPCVDAGRNAFVPADVLDLDLDGDVLERIPLDLDRLPRFADVPSTPDTGSGLAPVVDMGAHERPPR